MVMFNWVPAKNEAAPSVPSYLTSLGLDRHPFPVAPDDLHFYTSAYIEQVVAEIVHGIDARKGFMVISGDVGLGKTTVTRRILQILEEKQVSTSLVFHTSLKDVDLLREINRDFGLAEQEGTTDPATLGEELRRLNAFLTAQYRQGKNCAIIIDDAQNLDRTSLELVRMISNLEADCQKIVQILLVGQPELMVHLGMAELRQLKSRIFINKAVRPLSLDELRTYIVFKLSQAGNQGRITVTRKAFQAIHRSTAGNFRQVNMLMDRCLYLLCHEGGRGIDARHVRAAREDMHAKPAKKGWRLPALAASLVLPLILIAAGWTLHFFISRGATAAPRISSSSPASSLTAESTGAIQNRPEKGAVPVEVDPSIAAFLESVQLEEETGDFERARLQGNLASWAERILDRHGLQLVRLPALTDPVRRRYGALALPDGGGHRVQWLLFWRPTLTISKFYYGYQGREISRLQRMLAATGDYRHNIDGVVGPYAMKALVDFQARSGLPVTGWPDAATLFLLSQQEAPAS